MVQALKSGLYCPTVGLYVPTMDVEERINKIYERKAAKKEAMKKGRKPKESDKFHC